MNEYDRRVKADLIAEVSRAEAENARLRAHLEEAREQEALRLAACDVQALSNTVETFLAVSIDRDNPAWSAAYDSVRKAVAREMDYRAQLTAQTHALDQLKADKQALIDDLNIRTDQELEARTALAEQTHACTALREQIEGLQRYTEADVQRQPSTYEYLMAHEVYDVLAALLTEAQG